jgi:2-polyprenyl-6-methoxyphenol hydroxylase-like FAD-dependent oxidoreductase
VGLALAADLGWRGVSCRLIEQSDGVVTQPRMDLVGVRTMEFCRRWGIASWVENSPYPRDYPQDYVYVTALNGFELGREPFPCKRNEARPLQSPQKRERCPQDMFDPILARLARSFSSVDLQYDKRIESITEHADHVVARATNLRTGGAEEISASYLVGCDGASSFVRATLGIGMSGKPVLTHTTNAIIECADFEKLHDKGRAYRFIFIGPEGTFATIVAIDGRHRWRLSIVGNAEPKSYTADEVRETAYRAMGRPFDFKILSILPWVRRELVADSYGTQRVFLAGDSAHMLSPTGGFGMNTGIADAVDLAWKLEGAVKGWGGPRLLGSYEAERRPVAVRNVAEASRNLASMLAPRNERPPALVFQSGSAADACRREYGGRYAQRMRREWFTIGIHLGYAYEDSPLISPDGTPPPAQDVSTYTPTARPGSRAPHCWINHDHTESTLDLFGRGFVLLRLGRGASTDGFVARAAEARLPLTIEDLDYPGVRDQYQSPLVLVRPDGHVAWRGDFEPADAERIIDIARGAN